MRKHTDILLSWLALGAVAQSLCGSFLFKSNVISCVCISSSKSHNVLFLPCIVDSARYWHLNIFIHMCLFRIELSSTASMIRGHWWQLLKLKYECDIFSFNSDVIV